MQRWLFLLLFFPLIVWGEWDQLFNEEEDPTLFHHVNVITGNLNLCLQDTVVQGAKPFPMMRTYTSAGALEKSEQGLDLLLREMRGGFLIQGGWNFLPHANLLIEPDYARPKFRAYLAEPSGNLIRYTFSHKKSKELLVLKPAQTVTQNGSVLSARTNPQNNVLELDLKKGEATLYLPNGGVRKYKGMQYHNHKHHTQKTFYHLETESFSSGHQLCYLYNDKKRIRRIEMKNPKGDKTYSWVDFEIFKTKTPFHFSAKTSDGKVFDYQAMEFEERDYICKVSSSARAQEEISYAPGRKGIGARVASFALDGKEQFVAGYYLPKDKKSSKNDFSVDKVRVLEANVGPNGEKMAIASFIYEPGITHVRDVLGLLTRYHYQAGALTEIEYFDDREIISSAVQFHYNENGQLECKASLDGEKKLLFSKTFHYDAAGNVVEEILQGNLTGSGEQTSYAKKYTYLPESHLTSVEEEEEGPSYKYRYKLGTDLPTLKLTCDKEKILIREFFFYDDDNILIAEITDDGNTEDSNNLSGVSERRIKRYEIDPVRGLVSSMTESYLENGQEKLLKKIHYQYCPNFQACKEEVYDALGNYRYTMNTEYDSLGRIVRKASSLGTENTYHYDSLGNLLEMKETASPKKSFVYDKSSRPILSQEGEKVSKTTFDPKGRVLSQTDFRGNTTTQNYDAFGRCVQTDLPDGSSIQFAYDVQGNLVATKTPNGEMTETSYNTLRKPVHIIQRDGSEITHFYNKNGTLAQTIYPDSTEIHYTYDLFQRTTSKTIYSEGKIVAEEKWTYNAVHLLSYTNPTGLTTRYTYDGAGRKIAEEALSRTQTFTYDSLGFLERSILSDVAHVEIHDPLGNVIEQWEEDCVGTIENHTRFLYNQEGRKVKAIRKTSQGEAADLFFYDEEGRLIKHVDPQSAVTEFIYEDNNSKKIVIDPLGLSTVETYDLLNRLILLEKKSTPGQIVGREEFFYDRSGNKIKRISSVYHENQFSRQIVVSWEYDKCGRVIKEVEGKEKITAYAYDRKGRLSKRVLPSGISFFHIYDGLDRITELKSSDGKIHYQYVYAHGEDPTEIYDLVQNIELYRTYNLWGELVEEKNSFGHSYKWNYDTVGRCVSFTLPDDSKIHYEYSGLHLVKVGRSGYEHRYTEFDPNGHICKESLIGNLGVIETAHDLLERPFLQTTPWGSHSVSYGLSHLVTAVRSAFTGDKQVAYDPLNQITQEGEQTYQFDSLGNPLNCRANDLNQILSTPDFQLVYDTDGNLIEKISGKQTIFYHYDPLGRLTSIIYPKNKKISFIYDPLSRLICKQMSDGEKRFFLYDRDHEIGTLDPSGKVLQLKVLGSGIKGDIGAAIALELEGKVYAPLHDFSGNIIALISSKGKIAEKYNLTAFGVDHSSGTLSPWRFCSKRSDEGLIYFGLRFYDPSLGRWLTPDPSGFADGSNLYAYVRNSPLNRLDLFGLSSEQTFPFELRFDIAATPQNIPWHMPPSMHTMLHCKASCNEIETDCFIFYKNVHQFQFSPEGLSTGQVKIIDHFKDIMPKEGKTIGVSMLMNGMNVPLNSFLNMCQSTYSKLPEGHLFMGVYNPSEGLFKDFLRVRTEMKSQKDTPIICLTRQFLVAVADSLHKINPDLLFHLTTHSEGGLISLRSIEGMTPEQKLLMQQHLTYTGLGPALPMPLNYANRSVNYYSEKDGVTKRFSKPYLNNPNYDIQVMPCMTGRKDLRFFIGDHEFMKNTYQSVLTDRMEFLGKKIGFYETNTR